MSSKKSAVILVGQIRLNSPESISRWEEIKKDLKNYDVFICTYKAYESRARELSNKVLLVEDQKCNSVEYMGLEDSIFTTENSTDVNELKGFTVLWQHILMRKAVEHFHSELKNYKNIIKIRNDINFNLSEVEKSIENYPDFFHCASDFLYASRSDLFLKTFYKHSFLDFISKVWNKDCEYTSLNYKNLSKSLLQAKDLNTKGPVVKFTWMNFKLNPEDLKVNWDPDKSEKMFHPSGYLYQHNHGFHSNIKGVWQNLPQELKPLMHVNCPITPSHVINLCNNNISTEERSLDNFSIEKSICVTHKNFPTCFASEKQLMTYILFHSPIYKANAWLVKVPRDHKNRNKVIDENLANF